MSQKADVASRLADVMARNPHKPGAPMRFLYELDPVLKTDFDALSVPDQDEVLRMVDLVRQMPAITPAPQDLR